jgi:hypothetical protein
VIEAVFLVCVVIFFALGVALGFEKGRRTIAASNDADRQATPPERAISPAGAEPEPVEVELIKRAGDEWVRIGSRRPDHPDVHNVRAGLEPGVFIRGEHPDA